jgi:hypothetical protein
MKGDDQFKALPVFPNAPVIYIIPEPKRKGHTTGNGSSVAARSAGLFWS